MVQTFILFYFSDQFLALTHLHFLNMSRNMIEVIESDSMMPFANHLMQADFGYNKISFEEYQQSPFRKCSDLNNLDLSHNNITMIFKDWMNMPDLEYLNLEHNSISNLKVSS